MKNVLLNLLVGAAICSCCSLRSRADFIFSIGSAPLVSDSAAPQQLSLFMTWNGIGRADVVGLNLFTEIRGSGSALTPLFGGTAGTLQGFGYSASQTSGGSFQTSGPTIWDSILAAASPVSVIGAVPESGSQRRATVNVLSSNLVPFNFNSAANTPRLVAQYQINTQGVRDQQFQFFIGLEGGSSTDVIFSDGTSVSVGNSLSLNVGNAVPEGHYLHLLIIAGAVICGCRSRAPHATRGLLAASIAGNQNRARRILSTM